jgi:hypothetical protein
MMRIGAWRVVCTGNLHGKAAWLGKCRVAHSRLARLLTSRARDLPAAVQARIGAGMAAARGGQWTGEKS